MLPLLAVVFLFVTITLFQVLSTAQEKPVEHQDFKVNLQFPAPPAEPHVGEDVPLGPLSNAMRAASKEKLSDEDKNHNTVLQAALPIITLLFDNSLTATEAEPEGGFRGVLVMTPEFNTSIPAKSAAL